MDQLEKDIFEIIVNAGQGKAYVYEALAEAEEGKFENIDDIYKNADEYFNKAHNIQTRLMQDEMSEDSKYVSLLMVHAQDQLMTALESRELIKSLIKMYEKIYEKK